MEQQSCNYRLQLNAPITIFTSAVYLLRSDDGLKEKVIQDSKEPKDLNWKSYLLTGLGILTGIVIASIIIHDGIEWRSISWAAVATTAFLYLVFLLFPQGSKKSRTIK